MPERTSLNQGKGSIPTRWQEATKAGALRPFGLLVAAEEHPVVGALWPRSAVGAVVVDLQIAVFAKASEGRPIFERVLHRPPFRTLRQHFRLELCSKYSMQFVEKAMRIPLPHAPAILPTQTRSALLRRQSCAISSNAGPIRPRSDSSDWQVCRPRVAYPSIGLSCLGRLFALVPPPTAWLGSPWLQA